MSCLFDSLSPFVGKSSELLRQEVCDYIDSGVSIFDDTSNDDMIAWLANISKANYISSMRRTSTWGGALEIKAFCDMYKKNVRIQSLPNNRDIECLGRGADPRDWITVAWSGGHYSMV